MTSSPPEGPQAPPAQRRVLGHIRDKSTGSNDSIEYGYDVSRQDSRWWARCKM
jgi:hypothetical protein